MTTGTSTKAVRGLAKELRRIADSHDACHRHISAQTERDAADMLEAMLRERDGRRGMTNRVDYDHKGRLDEVVTDGGAHLEKMDKSRWFLDCIRSDGSSFALWLHGKVTLTEERDPPPRQSDDAH